MSALRFAGTAAALLARTNAFILSSPCLVDTLTSIPRQAVHSLGSSSIRCSSSDTSGVVFPLPFTELPYRGASVDIRSLENLPSDDKFLELLSRSLPIMVAQDLNSCWLRIPTHRSAIVAGASSQFGFELHHVDAPAAGNDGTIVMKKWLREGAEDKIPPYPNTQVGCAGLVMSENNEILLVKEWSGPLNNRTPSAMWKLPGGLLDAGESFAEASTREVLEETGVQCDYESMLTLWHRHGLAMHGISDIYVVALLKPRTESAAITTDPAEISDCRWMKVDKFLATQKHPLITRILETSYGLKKRDEGSGDDDAQYYADLVHAVGGGERLLPRIVMKEHDVRFGTRPAIPTYVGVPGGDGSSKVLGTP
mmetsp:Transcript_40907/g.80042  ORF Transcript_40907/g.80042 Transcript_40907/m.80042 type:complete len:367 (+) Transcript_40907:98-1198(+)